MRRVGGPIWNGEFGPVYQNAEDGLPDWQEINKRRYHVLEDQLDIYDKAKASWSIWLWKDIGFQGMVYVGEDTPYIKMLKPFLEKKKVGIGSVKVKTLSDFLVFSNLLWTNGGATTSRFDPSSIP